MEKSFGKRRCVLKREISRRTGEESLVIPNVQMAFVKIEVGSKLPFCEDPHLLISPLYL